MPERSRKDPHAVHLGRRGGLRGGKRRAEVLTAARRSEIAAHAARSRWGASPAAIPGAARERILSAALREFAERGYAGARVERIAQRAQVNKRILYRYFESKNALFRELLDRYYAELESLGGGSLADSIEATQAAMARNIEWMRIAAWDALRSDRSRGAVSRSAFWRRAVDEIREQQLRGELRGDVDAAQLQLSLVALVMFPFVMPRLAALITGKHPTDAAFLRDRAQALRTIAQWLSA